MAASLCCELFEVKVVASLPRPYIRPDNKLTTTERERLTSAFSLAWRISMENLENGKDLQEQMASLELKDMFRVREVAGFIVNNVPEPQRRELARLMGDGEKWDEVKSRARLVDVFVAGSQCLDNKNLTCYTQPDKAPLGLFAIFDHWQEDYMNQFE